MTNTSNSKHCTSSLEVSISPLEVSLTGRAVGLPSLLLSSECGAQEGATLNLQCLHALPQEVAWGYTLPTATPVSGEEGALRATMEGQGYWTLGFSGTPKRNQKPRPPATGAPTCEPSTEVGDVAPLPSGQHGNTSLGVSSCHVLRGVWDHSIRGQEEGKGRVLPHVGLELLNSRS